MAVGKIIRPWTQCKVLILAAYDWLRGDDCEGSRTTGDGDIQVTYIKLIGKNQGMIGF